jgi:hypothetical protein
LLFELLCVFVLLTTSTIGFVCCVLSSFLLKLVVAAGCRSIESFYLFGMISICSLCLFWFVVLLPNYRRIVLVSFLRKSNWHSLVCLFVGVDRVAHVAAPHLSHLLGEFVAECGCESPFFVENLFDH